jgi:TonB family protein
VRKISSLCAAGILACTAFLGSSVALAQANSQRKVLTRVAARYPELAVRMNVQGTVRIEVVVRTNGTVKSTRVLGGSPVLVQAAVEAAQRWRFAVSQNETTEIVQLTFVGQ